MQELYTLAKEKTQRWAEHAYEKVKVCYEQERFYLHHLSLYEKELEWALLDLRGMFLEGKEEDGVWIEEMIFPDTDEKYFKLFDKFYENYKYLDKIFNLGFYRDVKVAEEEKG
jgi:hypothetical protein